MSPNLSVNNQLAQGNFRDKKNFSSYLAITAFCLFICLYIYLILNDVDFAYNDDAQLTSFSIQGRFFAMPIWPSGGRYWPLGLQEYNFISLFSQTPLAYHSFSIVQLLITIILCFSILSSINLILRIFVVTTILTLSSFVISFSGICRFSQL